MLIFWIVNFSHLWIFSVSHLIFLESCWSNLTSNRRRDQKKKKQALFHARLDKCQSERRRVVNCVKNVVHLGLHVTPPRARDSELTNRNNNFPRYRRHIGEYMLGVYSANGNWRRQNTHGSIILSGFRNAPPKKEWMSFFIIQYIFSFLSSVLLMAVRGAMDRIESVTAVYYRCSWCVGLWCDQARAGEWLKLTDIVTGWSTVSGPVSGTKVRWGLSMLDSIVSGT